MGRVSKGEVWVAGLGSGRGWRAWEGGHGWRVGAAGVCGVCGWGSEWGRNGSVCVDGCERMVVCRVAAGGMEAHMIMMSMSKSRVMAKVDACSLGEHSMPYAANAPSPQFSRKVGAICARTDAVSIPFPAMRCAAPWSCMRAPSTRSEISNTAQGAVMRRYMQPNPRRYPSSKGMSARACPDPDQHCSDTQAAPLSTLIRPIRVMWTPYDDLNRCTR